MATIETYQRSALKKTNPLLTKLGTTVETAFYGSNMHEVTTLAEAYELAKTSPSSYFFECAYNSLYASLAH